MLSEENTPLKNRWLWIEGRPSTKSMALIRSGLPIEFPPNTEVLFVGFSYADLPLGKGFDVVFPKNRPEEGVICRSQIIAATQEMGTPFTEIPHGWKTICLIHFPEGIPALVQNLPTVGGWHQNQDSVCICERNVWGALTEIHIKSHDDLKDTQ